VGSEMGYKEKSPITGESVDIFREIILFDIFLERVL